MNETIKILSERKSCRSFADKEISKEDKEIILKALASAPTAGNMALYSVIDVTDQKLKDQLAISCDNQPFIAKAKMVLVFLADYSRWYKVYSDNVKDTRKPGNGDLLLAVADSLIAAQTCAIAAESLGINSCYIGDILEKYEYHRDLFALPKYVIPVAMLVMGYPTLQASQREKTKHFDYSNLVFENKYSYDKENEMESMLKKRHDLNEDEYKDWIVRFCNRKWDSDFSKEMSRSVDEMIKEWNR